MFNKLKIIVCSTLVLVLAIMSTVSVFAEDYDKYKDYNFDKNITEINIPDNITELKSYALANCPNLTKVNIGAGISTLPMACFMNCSSLEYIYIPDNITDLQLYSFAGDKNLKYIRLGPNIKTIGEYAFHNCGDIVICTDGETTKKSIEKYIKSAKTKTFNINITAENNYKNLIANLNSQLTKTSSTLTTLTLLSTTNTTAKFTTTRIRRTFPPETQNTKYNYTKSTSSTKQYNKNLGDVNIDGRIDSADATIILIYYASVLNGQKYNLQCKKTDADVNSDGRIDSADATIVLIYYAAKMLGYNVKITDF